MSTKNLEPNDAELRAIWQFASTDETRESLSTVWSYASEGGCTHVATDGHTLVARQSGTHVMMPHANIARLEPHAIGRITNAQPPAWSQHLGAPSLGGVLPPIRGINPSYVGRVATVEKAAGRRAADDYEPPVGESKKWADKKRITLRAGSCAEWVIGANVLDPWYWRIPNQPTGTAIVWEGLIMPRRP
jgi:hypothetical protein